MRKMVLIFLIYIFLGISFYAVHVISFVQGYNLSTDNQYDRIHSDMIKHSINAGDLLKMLQPDEMKPGEFFVQYPYIFYRIIIIDRGFNWRRISRWTHISLYLISNEREH